MPKAKTGLPVRWYSKSISDPADMSAIPAIQSNAAIFTCYLDGGGDDMTPKFGPLIVSGQSDPRVGRSLATFSQTNGPRRSLLNGTAYSTIDEGSPGGTKPATTILAWLSDAADRLGDASKLDEVSLPSSHFMTKRAKCHAPAPCVGPRRRESEDAAGNQSIDAR